MTSLSVVMPVYNEAEHLPETIDALVEAVERSGFDAELVLVDDGSTDGSARVTEQALGGRLPFDGVAQQNRGRFEARRAGLEHARCEWVLLLDGRVRLRPTSLGFVRDRLEAGEIVWNGHVRVETEGNPYGTFQNVLTEVGWRRYFDNPRTTSYGSEDFDHYPKGTGCFVAPRELLLDAIAAFRPRISNARIVSDDTQLIRWIAERERIHVSPSFACDYQPRTDLRSFLSNSVYRGSTFLDGHARRDSRFLPVVVCFYPVSAAIALAALRRPIRVLWAAMATSAAAAGLGLARHRNGFEIASLALLAPLYAAAHGVGMWRGAGLVARQRIAPAPRL